MIIQTRRRERGKRDKREQKAIIKDEECNATRVNAVLKQKGPSPHSPFSRRFLRGTPGVLQQGHGIILASSPFTDESASCRCRTNEILINHREISSGLARSFLTSNFIRINFAAVQPKWGKLVEK